MEPYDRSRDTGVQPIFFPQMSSHPPGDASRAPPGPSDPGTGEDKDEGVNVAFMKGPKRKRLAKACDACHKSKRRCDGTAPCSNCYFASKKCTYTDASGRPVPAPRPFKAEKPEPPSDTRPAGYPPHTPEPWPPPAPSPSSTYNNPYPPEASSSHDPLDQSEDELGGSRKRFRSEHGNTAPPPESISRHTVPAIHPVRQSGLDPALTRELVNLFFTHCHPPRLMIHKPTFSVALSQNQVPQYLLNAMCSLSAQHSKQPRLRTSPSRFAGKPFAQDAVSMMFDGSGRLVCDPNLATAQALCLLQLHEIITAQSTWTTRYHELALHVLEKLDVHKPNNPVLTPVPSREYMHESIERECIRRVFWLVCLTDMMISVWFKRPALLKEDLLALRLPVDETSFELAVHSTLSEYLFQPAPRTHYASEFGHLIRVFSIYTKVESTLDTFIASDGPHSYNSLMDSEKALEGWASTLPDHLRFSTDTLQVQLSMFETSSNTSAWCFCLMHVIHAACALALNVVKQRTQRALSGPEWALTRLNDIIRSLGGRARHSPLLGAALWPQMKYCKRDDPQIMAWSAENDEIWGMRVEDFVPMEWRPQHLQQQARPPVEYRLPSGPLSTAADKSQQPHRDDDTSQRSLSSSPSAYPVGRTFHELRLHNRPSHIDNNCRLNDKDSRRLISDVDIDPALQGGTNLRNHAASEGPLSLPSLKASGLLDSWSSPNDGPSGSGTVPLPSWTPATASHSRPDMQQHPSLSRRPPSRNGTPSLLHPSGRTDLDMSRAPPSGMPVGLPWLANETSVPRPS